MQMSFHILNRLDVDDECVTDGRTDWSGIIFINNDPR